MGEYVFDVSENEYRGAIYGGADWLSDEGNISPVQVSALTDITGNYIMRGVFYGSGTTFTVTPTKEVKLGRSLELDGVDDQVLIDPLSSDITNTFMMEMWVKPQGSVTLHPESNNGATGTAGQRYAIYPALGDDVWGAGHVGAGISIGTNGISVYEHGPGY